MSPLTIIMYHYVRPLARTRYPDIRGLDLALFDEQLDFLQRHYHPVSMEDVVGALDGHHDLPRRAVLLTFDDGYLDHYTYVFPRLAARNLAGAFYPPSQVVLEHRLLDVNRIHYILASGASPVELVATIENAILSREVEFGLDEPNVYRERFCHSTRYDSAEVAYVKRLLQHALPEKLRVQLATELFEQYVSADEMSFTEELYLSLEQLRVMASAGQHVGSHGDAHYWLSSLPADLQRADIAASVHMLDQVGVPSDCRTLCYPYGDYNADTLAILNETGFRAAVTTRVALADLHSKNRYELPRLDTNDLPKSAFAPTGSWTLAADAD